MRTKSRWIPAMIALALAACARPAPKPAPGPTTGTSTAVAIDAGAEPFQLKDYVFEDDWDAGSAVPHKHDDWRYGNYIDRKTHQPAVGMHSHDPVKGNAE
jgi:hypothetical protein